MEAAIGINEIDGLVLTNKDLEKYYDYANGKITSSELEEYITNISKKMVRG